LPNEHGTLLDPANDSVLYVRHGPSLRYTFAPAGNYVAATNGNDEFELYDAASLLPFAPVETGIDDTTAIAITESGAMAAVGNRSGDILFFLICRAY
jgi:hypothetical protein